MVMFCHRESIVVPAGGCSPISMENLLREIQLVCFDEFENRHRRIGFDTLAMRKAHQEQR